MPAPYRLAVGGYTPFLTTLAFDGAGSLQSGDLLEAENASWLVPHPSAAGVWFATSEIEPGYVRVLKLDAAGDVLASVKTGGIHPTHLAVGADGQELFVANYSSGDVSVLRILSSAPYLTDEDAQLVSFTYVPPGPSEPQTMFNPGRQEGSHPHQVLVVPANHEVLVPDLGSDKIWRLQKQDAKWKVTGFILFPRGRGPRHAFFHDGVLYTVCELSNQLAAHHLPPLPENAAHILALPTLPTPAAQQDKVLLPSELAYTSSLPPTPAPVDTSTDLNQVITPHTEVHEPPPPTLAAEILSPAPHEYIYVSNRNETHPEGDSIAIFTPYPKFELVAHVRTGVNHLRGMAFSPGDERWLAIAGQNGGGVKVFERVSSQDGWLKPVQGAFVAAGGEGVDGPEKTTSVTWI